jgi:hypothetical protein
MRENEFLQADKAELECTDRDPECLRCVITLKQIYNAPYEKECWENRQSYSAYHRIDIKHLHNSNRIIRAA